MSAQTSLALISGTYEPLHANSYWLDLKGKGVADPAMGTISFIPYSPAP